MGVRTVGPTIYCPLGRGHQFCLYAASSMTKEITRLLAVGTWHPWKDNAYFNTPDNGSIMSSLFCRLCSIMTAFIVVRIFQAPQRTFGWSMALGNHVYPLSTWAFPSAKRARSATLRLKSVMSDSNNQEFSTSIKVELTAEQKDLLQNWRDHPSINPTLVFPTLMVSSDHLQQWIKHPLLQPYLAKPSNWNLLHHIHPRIKQIQDFNDTHKLLLLLRNENNDRSHVVAVCYW